MTYDPRDFHVFDKEDVDPENLPEGVEPKDHVYVLDPFESDVSLDTLVYFKNRTDDEELEELFTKVINHIISEKYGGNPLEVGAAHGTTKDHVSQIINTLESLQTADEESALKVMKKAIKTQARLIDHLQEQVDDLREGRQDADAGGSHGGGVGKS